jgi:NADH-quinone oxidoreductase subunit A
MGTLAGPKRWNRAKLEAYECGIEPTPTPPGGGKIPVKYYLTAMLFIVTVAVVFAYAWRRGGLDWD